MEEKINKIKTELPDIAKKDCLAVQIMVEIN